MDIDVNGSAIAEIIALATAQRVQALPIMTKSSFAVMPPGWSAESLEALQERPNRITDTQVFSEVRSLGDYLLRYSLAGKTLFRSRPTESRISAVINYHDAAQPHGVQAQADWCGHTAEFRARFSPEYEAWRKLDRKPIRQTEAGEFLEDRLHDITVPVGADVMEMIMKFDALKKVTFSQSTRLRDGYVQIRYQEEDQPAGALTIPEMFTLLVPIYEGQEPSRVDVRLRFRLDSAKLTFVFVIGDRERIEREAFKRSEDQLVTYLAESNYGAVTLLRT